MLIDVSLRLSLFLMRAFTTAILGWALLCGSHAAAAIDFSKPQSFDIPPQALSAALVQFSSQAGVQFSAPGNFLEGVKTGGVHGQYPPGAALQLLLKDTGLAYRQIDEGTVAISRSGSEARASAMTSGAPRQGKEGKRGSSDTFHLAQADQGGPQTAGSLASNSVESRQDVVALEEVVVTAQKREERLRDVPIPVTALSANTLLENNQLRMQDYAALIPGLSAPLQGPLQVLSIRGVTTGKNTNPTVGITVDDVPYGASTNLGTGGGLIPDIDPADLARIEVLRGPQGTLYGASSMGGLLKFVTVDPSTDHVSGRLQVSGTDIHHGAGEGYSVSGAVNVPLSGTVAVRASGFVRETPGYIDNVETGQRGVNEERARGMHLAALWKPTQDFSIKLGALVQRTTWDGSNDVFVQQPGVGDLQQSYIRDTGAKLTTVQQYSAVVNAKLGQVSVVSITGYNISSYDTNDDVTSALGQIYSMPSFGVAGAPLIAQSRSNKLTQEVRLSDSIGSWVDWIVGGFYTHEDSKFAQGVLGEDLATGVVRGADFYATVPSFYREYAGFADLTFHLTDRFDVQVGGRESDVQEVTRPSITTGALFNNAIVVTPRAEETANVFTYLVTPRFKISPDLMVYARLASGYRPGGPNPAATTFGTRTQFSPDKTKNYELGAKADFLNHALSMDASLYYIDWTGIQLGLVDKFAYIGNANKAKSEGAELSIQARPYAGFTVTAWVAWNEAVLTEPFPTGSPAQGAAGDRLPYSSRFSGNISLEQSFPITTDVAGFLGAGVSYVSDREGEFASIGGVRALFPAYAKADLRVGVNYDNWTASLFANNVADRRVLLSGGTGLVPYAYQVLQPRTIGLSLIRRF